MKPLLLMLLLSLAGCAALSENAAPGCHGARRPANPHGSVLAPDAAAPKTPPAAPPAAGCLGGPR
jgi:hypothetical protein